MVGASVEDGYLDALVVLYGACERRMSKVRKDVSVLS